MIVETSASRQTLTLILQVPEEQKELLTILRTALNCKPEFNKDWFIMCDKLEAHLQKQGTPP